MSNLKKMGITHLKPGMYLHALDGSWIDHPFWRSKFIIAEEHIRLLQESCILEVWIDVDLGHDVVEESAAANAIAAMPATSSANLETAMTRHIASSVPAKNAPKAVPMADEIERARIICESASRAVKSMFEEARMGKAISMDSVGETVQEISLSVMRNPGALVSVARLKNADDYTYMHSVAVCALMVALARQLDLDDQQTREAGMAGLMHDIGKIATPPEILNKTGKLTPEEFVIIKRHPVEGHALLCADNQVSEVTRDVCLHHHERIDGKGYPHGLSGDGISLFAKMGAVCDVYDAITSNRPYKKGWCPADSIKQMADWSANQYDKRVFDAFVRSVGIYPVGSLVRLASGKLGVVLEQSTKSLVTPKVKVFFSTKSSLYIAPTVIDLSLTMADASAEKIVGYEDPLKWKFKNFDQMWASY